VYKHLYYTSILYFYYKQTQPEDIRLLSIELPFAGGSAVAFAYDTTMLAARARTFFRSNFSTSYPIFHKTLYNFKPLEITPKSHKKAKCDLIRWQRHYGHLIQSPEIKRG
jgi:hypothetical protein